MLRTLRSRLILSHVGLLLILIPMLGVALIYVLESRVVLVNLAHQVTGQAVLVGELLKQDPAALSDRGAAAAFVARIAPLFPGELSVLDVQGRLLASSDVDDTDEVDKFQGMPGLPRVMQGRSYSRVRWSRDARAEAVDVLVPVLDEDGRVQAIVRITDFLSSALDRFARLRLLIGVILAVALVVGTILGYLLSVTVQRPLMRLTRAVEAYPQHTPAALLAKQGPEEVRVLARAFQGMLERVQHLEENRRYLLSNIIHELGRPLGAMRAADRALLDGAGEDPRMRGDLLHGIDGEIDRMERLLDEMAGLREVTAGNPLLRPEPLALSEWLPRLLAPWREATLAAGLAWHAEIPAGLPTVHIDPARLGQALGNLLSNAIKYTPAPGEVRVSASAGEASWQFQVADTGPGIPEGERERVFEAFYRTPPERHYPQGLGLGLTIARNLVRGHGGDIVLEGCQGAGACFTVRLPLQVELAASA